MLAAPDATLLLMAYLLYARSQGESTLRRGLSAALQSFRVTSFWEKLYRELLRDAGTFERISKNGAVAVAAKPLRVALFGGAGDFEPAEDNYLLHDFADPEEAVQAYVATGEATARGFTRGVPVLADGNGFTHGSGEATALPTKYCDGGAAAIWGRSTHCLYYHTWFDTNRGDLALCTVESVERLFLQGVDDALAILAGEDGARGFIIAPSDDIELVLARSGRTAQFLQRGVFVEVRQRVVRTVKEVCVKASIVEAFEAGTS